MTTLFDEFVCFLLKENNSFHRKSWVSPEGDIFFLQGEEHHATAAERILKINDQNSYFNLMKNGWQALSSVRTDSGGIIWVRNEQKIKPNNKQLKSIKDLAIENGFSEISVEQGNFNKLILWEK